MRWHKCCSAFLKNILSVNSKQSNSEDEFHQEKCFEMNEIKFLFVSNSIKSSRKVHPNS